MKQPESARARRDAWQDVIQRQEKSGLSVRVFCGQHGVREPAFYQWRKRLAGDERLRFALVETNKMGQPQQLALELALTTGERLQIPAGVDAATLRTVLAALRERA